MIARLVLARVALALVTLLVVSASIFIISEVLPGDIAARVLGRESTSEARELFRERLNLDHPVYERYGVWLKGAVQGDFGQSLVSEQPVGSLVAPALTGTLKLAAFALFLYVPVTLLFAIVGAVYRGRAADKLTSFVTLVGLSIPEFVLATFLIFLFAVKLQWLPALTFIDPSTSFFGQIQALTLPAVTLATTMAAYAIRMLRESLIDVLDSEYIRMAVLKGVPRWRVVLRHALPNAVGPTLSVTAMNLSYVIGGVVVVEQVFAYPGVGKVLVDAIAIRDVPVIEAVTLIASAAYIAANLAADAVGLFLNPRLRTA